MRWVLDSSSSAPLRTGRRYPPRPRRRHRLADIDRPLSEAMAEVRHDVDDAYDAPQELADAEQPDAEGERADLVGDEDDKSVSVDFRGFDIPQAVADADPKLLASFFVVADQVSLGQIEVQSLADAVMNANQGEKLSIPDNLPEIDGHEWRDDDAAGLSAFAQWAQENNISADDQKTLLEWYRDAYGQHRLAEIKGVLKSDAGRYFAEHMDREAAAILKRGSTSSAPKDERVTAREREIRNIMKTDFGAYLHRGLDKELAALLARRGAKGPRYDED